MNEYVQKVIIKNETTWKKNYFFIFNKRLFSNEKYKINR